MMSLDDIDPAPPFHFVGEVLARYRRKVPAGFCLHIDSGMLPDVGLGTSAAVTVALLAAMQVYAGQEQPCSPSALHQEAWSVIRAVQGQGSGADAAASVYGGIVLYRQDAGVLETFSCLPTFRLYYAGYKTPTADVIQKVEAYRQAAPQAYARLDRRMDACSLAVAAALRQADLAAVARGVREGQAILEALGVCDEPLARMVTFFGALPGTTAVKISGSGLGDCVLVLGAGDAQRCVPYRQIPATFGREGVQVWQTP